MDSRVEEELIGVAHAWDRAMVANDPEAIGAYIATTGQSSDPMAASVTRRLFSNWCDRGS